MLSDVRIVSLPIITYGEAQGSPGPKKAARASNTEYLNPIFFLTRHR